MNEAMPAVAALAGGSAALATIYARERAVDGARRASRRALRLTFPMGVTERQAAAAVAELAGADDGYEFVFETRATPESTEHYLHVPDAVAEAVRHQVPAAIPGLRAELMAHDRDAHVVANMAMRVFVPHFSMLRREGAESAGRAVLAHLAQLQADEHLRVFIAARPGDPKLPAKDPTTPVEREHHRRLRSRIGQASFTCAGLVVARSGSVARSRALVDGVAQVLRARSGHGRPLRFVSDRAGRRLGSAPKTSRRTTAITAAELAGLISWPLGTEPIAQVARGATREMLASRSVGQDGIELFVGRDVAGERPIRLPTAAQRLHTVVIGATGSGKSTLITNVVLQAMAAGQAGLVVDPKEGLVQAIIDRVPDGLRDRVVVMDPADLHRPVGIDLFAAGDADTRAEAITGTLRAIFAPQGAWGVRADSYISLAIRSLAVLERPSLLLVGRLLTDAGLRQRVVGGLQDPVLKLAWSTFNDLGPEAQREHVAAPLNRLMSLLQRPAVRAAIAQPAPKLNLGRLWQERMWVLIDLSPGTMGEGASRLLGAICGYLAWSTLEARTSQAAAARVPTNLVFDELQWLGDLPVSIERLAERARSYAGQLFLATQTVARLPTPLAESVFGNFSTVLTFRASAREARRLAPELPGLGVEDLMSLPPYGVAARVASGSGTAIVTLTGRTEPLPPPTGNASYIRERSAALYGTPRDELERAIAEQLGGDLMADDRPTPGRVRRAS